MDRETLKTWTDFENDCNIQDSFRLTNPTRRLYTYTSKISNKIKSHIDRIYLSSNLSGKVISSSFIYNKASDHKIVKLKLASDVDKGPGMWVFNNTLLTDREFTNLISVTIRNLVLNRRILNIDNKYFWDILSK